MVQLRNRGAVRHRIRYNFPDWGSCTAHISTDGMDWAERLQTSLDSHPELGIIAGWAVVALALVLSAAIASHGADSWVEQGTCSFSPSGSLYYSWIKSVNGLTLRRLRRLDLSLPSPSERF